MILSQDDAAQFFRLMWGLQFYVNQQKQLLPDVNSYEVYANLDSQQKIIVRDALWKHTELIDVYIKDNPDKLSEEELTLIGKWKGFIAGQFYIFRYLKDHAIFIADSQVYGVKGLYEPFTQIFYGRPLPILVETVLLPYKGQIIYDGMCRTYNIYFGGGIRGNLKEEYMVAKQNGRIRTTLEPEFEKPSKKPVLAPDSKKVVADIVHSSSQLRGGTVVQETAFEVLRASAKVVEEAVLQKEDLEKVRRTCQKVFNALKRLEKVLDRAER